MKRQLISSLLALSMVFGAAAYLPEGLAAQSGIVAQAEDKGDFEYFLKGSYNQDGYTIIIKKYNGKDSDVTIPSEIDGMPVTGIDLYECTSIKRITIPESVTDITLYKCTSLTSINVDSNNPNYSSRDGVLYNKDKTELIRFPEGKESITIPKRVTSIGELAFSYCKKLTSITIPKSVTSIGDNAFRCCETLTSVTIPNSVTSIGEYAFANCQSLKKITIPDSVTNIGYGAFSFCKALTDIAIPESVTSIGYCVFRSCTNLKSITIPNGVISIDSDAFSRCTSLESIILPNSLTTIYNDAIKNCTSLKRITIPKSVKTLGKYSIGYNYIEYEDEDVYEKIPGFTIYCYPGSAAEKYAKENGFKYKYALSFAKATLSKTSYTYSGKAKKPSVTVKLGKTTLKKGTDYTVTYKNNKKIGKATVTIKGKGAYTGTVTKTFKINPKKTTVKKLTTPKTKQIKVTYKKVSGVTGYQITYSTSSKYTKSTTKTVNVTSTSKTIKSLKKGKTYYVKVRSYKTVNGTKYYSTYSKVKSIKVK